MYSLSACGSHSADIEVDTGVTREVINTIDEEQENQSDKQEKSNIEELVGIPEEYDIILSEMYDIIISGNLGSSEIYNTFNIYQSIGHMNIAEILNTLGYSITDINNDNIPELIIGIVDENSSTGNSIFNLYTYVDGNPVMVIENHARSYYSFLGDGKFYYTGFSGAAHSGFGIYSLPANSEQLVCEKLWFSDLKSETEIGYYTNTSGNWDIAESEELSISNEEFWEISDDIGPVEDLEFVRFNKYDKSNIIDTIDLWAETSKESNIAAVAYLGYHDGDLESFKVYAEDMGIMDKYSFISDINDAAIHDGGEWYLVIPDENVTITVDEAVIDESTWTVTPGENLLETVSKPILIRCNISEIFSNTIVNFKQNDNIINYSPSISLMDGSLLESEYIFDFTPYDLLDHYKLKIITDTSDPEYQYYYKSKSNNDINTPIEGTGVPVTVLVMALKDDLTIRVDMDGSETHEPLTMMAGDVVFVNTELRDDECPVVLNVISNDGDTIGTWYAVTRDGNTNYKELIS